MCGSDTRYELTTSPLINEGLSSQGRSFCDVMKLAMVSSRQSSRPPLFFYEHAG